MKLPVTHQTEKWIDEGIFVTELVNSPACPTFSLARCRLPGLQETQLHRLSIDEWYVIEEGRGMIRVGDDIFEVEPGDSIAIQRGTPQSIRNSGDTDLIFQVVCTPRFTQECYESVER